ncbi:MAG TPA: hypothetical protein VGI39_31820 [Polyangiaceae bacterium]|jgi:hypothetical protein
MRARVAWLVLLFGLLGEGSATAAMRVAVRVTDPVARALTQRVRGQTSDLDVELVEVESPPLEARTADEVATAAALAHRLEARVVLWFDAAPSGLTLFFSVPEERRTLLRTMEGEATGSSSSATFEASALVVRSVLRALAQGGSIGVTLARPLDEPAPPPAPLPPPSPPPEPPKLANPLPGAVWGLDLSAGWRGILVDGHTPLQGGDLRAGGSLGRVRFGLQGAFDLPAETSDAYAKFRILRLEGAAFVAYVLPASPQIEVSFGLLAGAVGFERETLAVATGGARTPAAWLGSPLVSPEAGMAYRGEGRGFSWAIGLRAGLDVVFSPPTIGENVAGAFIAERDFSVAEPRAGIDFALRVP